MTGRWLLRFPRRPDARLRLVCVPGAGCTASMFHGWAEMLPDEVEVCAVQVPGRGSRLRETPFTRMDPLADALTEVVLAESDLPVVMLGHSLGALIAYEVTDRLCRMDRAPVALIAAAHKAPSLGSAGLTYHLLPDDELVGVVDALGGTPGGTLANPAIRKLALPSLRADFELDANYEFRERPPLSIPVSVFGGDNDAIVSTDELRAWRAHTTGDFALRVVSGGHFFHNDQGGADMFTDMRDTLLDRLQRLTVDGERHAFRVRG